MTIIKVPNKFLKAMNNPVVVEEDETKDVVCDLPENFSSKNSSKDITNG
jgi:hypothetical protein